MKGVILRCDSCYWAYLEGSTLHNLLDIERGGESGTPMNVDFMCNIYFDSILSTY